MDAIYEGSWVKGEPEGTGKFVHVTSGIIQHGLFENGNWKIVNITNK